MKRSQLVAAALLTKQANGFMSGLNTVTDYLPFIGAAKDLGRSVGSFSRGDWKTGLGQAASGIGFGALDFATGGLGSAVAKGGIKALGRGALTQGFKRALPWSLGAGVVDQGVQTALGTGTPQPPASPGVGWGAYDPGAVRRSVENGRRAGGSFYDAGPYGTGTPQPPAASPMGPAIAGGGVRFDPRMIQTGPIALQPAFQSPVWPGRDFLGRPAAGPGSAYYR